MGDFFSKTSTSQTSTSQQVGGQGGNAYGAGSTSKTRVTGATSGKGAVSGNKNRITTTSGKDNIVGSSNIVKTNKISGNKNVTGKGNAIAGKGVAVTGQGNTTSTFTINGKVARGAVINLNPAITPTVATQPNDEHTIQQILDANNATNATTANALVQVATSALAAITPDTGARAQIPTGVSTNVGGADLPSLSYGVGPGESPNAPIIQSSSKLWIYVLIAGIVLFFIVRNK